MISLDAFVDELDKVAAESENGRRKALKAGIGAAVAGAGVAGGMKIRRKVLAARAKAAKAAARHVRNAKIKNVGKWAAGIAGLGVGSGMLVKNINKIRRLRMGTLNAGNSRRQAQQHLRAKGYHRDVAAPVAFRKGPGGKGITEGPFKIYATKMKAGPSSPWPRTSS